MALVDCRDCGQKVSDSAAACPGCGAIRKAYNELNWPAFHMAGAALVISVATATLPPSMGIWPRLATITVTGLLVTILAWVVPHIAENRRFKKQDKARTKYTPSSLRGD